MLAQPNSDDTARLSRGRLQYDLAFVTVLAARRFRARFTERLKSQGQTDARWSALYILAEAPKGLIQADLAERMGVQSPTLVRLLDALERQGLIRRTSEPGDRRAKRVVIEEAGRQAVGGIDGVAARLRDEVFKGLTDEDLKNALYVLNRVAEALDPVEHNKTPRRSRPPVTARREPTPGAKREPWSGPRKVV